MFPVWFSIFFGGGVEGVGVLEVFFFKRKETNRRGSYQWFFDIDNLKCGIHKDIFWKILIIHWLCISAKRLCLTMPSVKIEVS